MSNQNQVTKCCCGTCDCGTCSCNCQARACKCLPGGCRCACRKPANRKAHKAQRLVAGLILMAGLLGAPKVWAQEAGTWQRGTLIGLETRTTTSEGVRSEHYEERQTKNGKKEFNGYSYAPDQTTVT